MKMKWCYALLLGIALPIAGGTCLAHVPAYEARTALWVMGGLVALLVLVRNRHLFRERDERKNDPTRRWKRALLGGLPFYLWGLLYCLTGNTVDWLFYPAVITLGISVVLLSIALIGNTSG